MRQKYQYPGTFRDMASHISQPIATFPPNDSEHLRKAILKKIEHLLPNHISPQLLDSQLKTSPFIATADHHALLNYKLLYNSNLLYMYIIKNLKIPYMVVSATGSIPLTNNSYPRGFYFKKQKFNFFSKGKSNVPVFLFQSKLSGRRSEGLKSIILNYSRELLNPEEEKFLEYLFFEALEIEKAGEEYDLFSDQITFLNFKLWKYYFEKSFRPEIPGLVYFQVNDIIKDALIQALQDENSFVSRVLFDPAVRKAIKENFNGIQGAWENGDKGTMFFWGVSESQRFVNLRIDTAGNCLKGEVENIVIPFNRDSIIDALLSKKIVPSLFLDFLIITFQEGYIALGGFNQLEYLPQMQKAFVKTLEEIGMPGKAAYFANRVTDGLICGMFPFRFDSGIDLIWNYNNTGGKFNGNLDGGLRHEDIEKMADQPVKDMIAHALETMLDSVGIE